MAIFALVADETNILNQRFTTWECAICMGRIRCPEFPRVDLQPYIYGDCKICDLIHEAAHATDHWTEDELENFANQVNEPNEPTP